MNAAMSSRRTFEHAATSGRGSEIGLSLLGLVAGILLMGLGIVVDVPLIAGAGFVAFSGSFLYLNAMFWGYVYSRRENESDNR